MTHYTGELLELLLESNQNAAARLALPHAALPAPGQYLQAHHPDNPQEILPASLFPAAAPHTNNNKAILPIAGPLPAHWVPGITLHLRGPLGKGFTLPKRLRRLALAALGASPSRLLPLVNLALKASCEISLICDSPIGDLPLEVEQQPLGALAETLSWAGFLAIDLPLEMVRSLPTLFDNASVLKPRGQVLVHAPMPCGGLAQCGVCAFATSKGERLACEDGPVFDLAALL